MSKLTGNQKPGTENVWIEAYKQTLRTEKAYKRRLAELQSWDKPFTFRGDPNGRLAEWQRKIDALNYLLSTIKPKQK